MINAWVTSKDTRRNTMMLCGAVAIGGKGSNRLEVRGHRIISSCTIDT